MRIFVTTRFDGVHAYPAAPDEVSHLRNPHRHLFHVRAELSVTHDDRELEFLLVKRAIDSFLAVSFASDLGAMSCEQMASEILAELQRLYGSRQYLVEVSEDGENGAIVVGNSNAATRSAVTE